MNPSPELVRGDAFDRAIRETFGVAITPEQVAEARKLYARYRTDDLLKRLRSVTPDKNGEPQPWD
jgi:hypothetical protein